MGRFERRLAECLEAVRSGALTPEQCLARYPEDAERLRPLLEAAYRLQTAFSVVKPGEKFRTSARERFLVATGKPVVEAFKAEPDPSFLEGARRRFLWAAARLMPLRARPAPTGLRLGPVAVGVRPMSLAFAAVAVACLLSFGSFTMVTSSHALPGDWQYTVKRFNERVRLFTAVTDSQRRSVRLDIARERVREVETLAEKGRTINQSDLQRLTNDTVALTNEVSKTADTSDAQEASRLAENSERVLADVQPMVKPEALDTLAEAQEASAQLRQVATFVATSPSVPSPPAPTAAVATPTAGARVTGPAAMGAPSPTAQASPQPSAGASPAGTAEAPTPTSTPGPLPPPLPVRGRLVTGPVGPADEAGGVRWSWVVIGGFSAEVPAGSDWGLDALLDETGSAPAPAVIRLWKADGSILAITVHDGSVLWYIRGQDGFYYEVQLRRLEGDAMVTLDADAVRALLGPAADIPLHVAASIQFGPEPAATPTATPGRETNPLP